MRSGRLVAVTSTLVLLIGFPFSAAADEIDDQRARVEQIADQLESLENRLGELDESYGATLDRIDELTGEIAASQTRVDEMSVELAAVRAELEAIAIARFTSDGSGGLTPLFTTAQIFTDELQRTELTRVALDQGAGDTDEMEAIFTDLADATAALETKKSEQAELLATLEEQREQGEALSLEYSTQFDAAEAELGNLIAEEQERRAAAAIAEAQARERERAQAQAAAKIVVPPPRGGGAAAPPPVTPPPSRTPPPATVPTAAAGSGAADAPATPAPPVTTSAPPPTDPAATTPDVPPPASTAGIAVNAAYGQLGVPYRFAAEAPGEAFDCSGLTKYAWGRAGVYLPHQSSQQYASTPHVSQDQVQPGDLIFYYSPIGHVGIYIGGGSLIHAPASGDVVKVSTVSWGKVVGVSRPG